jgi:hypothetical protein
VRKYRRVADRLASLLEVSLRSAFAAWRGAAADGRVARLRAERHHAAAARRAALRAWRAAAAGGRERARSLEEGAAALRFALAGGHALAAWRGAAGLARARRAALARAVMASHEAARLDLMAGALAAWRARAARLRGVRASLVAFVNRRRLDALAEYLSYWREYAAAMRAAPAFPPGSPIAALLPPMLSPRSAHQDRRLLRRMALLQGGIEVRRRRRPPPLVGRRVRCRSPGFRNQQARLIHHSHPNPCPPTLGQVECGSDDGEASLLAGLPPSDAAAAALARAERQAAFCRVRGPAVLWRVPDAGAPLLVCEPVSNRRALPPRRMRSCRRASAGAGPRSRPGRSMTTARLATRWRRHSIWRRSRRACSRCGLACLGAACIWSIRRR